MHRRVFAVLFALAAAPLLARCEGSTGTGLILRFSDGPRAGEIVSAAWTPFTVELADASGEPVDLEGLEATLSVTDGTGVLGGTLTKPLVDSEAVFDDLTYDTREPVTVRVSIGDVATAVEAVVVVTGEPDHLAFGYEPATQAQVDTIFSFFTVEVRDAADDRVYADDGTSISLTHDGTGTLGGTTTVNTVEGQAVFSDITYDTAEEIDLTAEAGGEIDAVFSFVAVQDTVADGEDIARASVATGGTEAVGGHSVEPVVSGDGRYVSFESRATNLVTQDTAGLLHVFVYDRIDNTTELVSISTGGDAADGRSCYPAISADGRYIAYNSAATNLVSDVATGGQENLYIRDRFLGTTVLVSRSPAGAPGGGGSDFPEISSDGRFIAYHSASAALAPGDENDAHDIFVYDQLTDLTERVSVADDGSEGVGTGGTILGAVIPAISDDGAVVAFTADFSNLVADDTNSFDDVFVRDRIAGTTTRVSVSSAGVQGNAPSSNVHLSGDGRYVAFESAATTLVPDDTNGVRDVFVHDRDGGTTVRASVDSEETQAVGGHSKLPGLSKDGRFVAFESAATNLVAGDTNGLSDIFVRDLQDGETLRVNLDSIGTQAAGGLSGLPYFSHDGRFIAFQSRATNLVPGDTNALQDIFIAPNPLFP